MSVCSVRIGFFEGVWIVGIIDEIRMHKTETDGKPIIVEIKTCARDRFPTEPQRRNGRYAAWQVQFNVIEMMIQ